MSATLTLTPKQQEALVEAGKQELARRHLLDLMRYCWWMPEPLLEGLHTRAICARFDQAIEDYEREVSTFLCIKVIFRHGKSDIGSRALPAYFLGRMAPRQPDVIIDSYGADLSESFSRKVQAIVSSDQYQRVFPGVRISKAKSAAYNWQIEGSAGEVTVAGVSGGFTGKGGALIIADDLFKNREEAESPTQREKVWEHIRGDLVTRRAPVSIVVFMGTPWHVDDHFGRIQREMESNPKFPRFEFLTFPGESPDYPTGYLFPERFSPTWYQEQRAILGSYQAAGLMDCEPTLRGGNMLKTENIRYADERGNFTTLDGRPMKIPSGLLWVRAWDLASTAKQVGKPDPDHTWGTRQAYAEIDGLPWLFINDSRHVQAKATVRNRLIEDTALADGPEVWQGVETVAGYKDTADVLREVLDGKAVVHEINADADKIVCAARVEPLFEYGRVVMVRGPWNDALVKDLTEFPGGAHDDGTDSVSRGYVLAKRRWEESGKFGGAWGRGRQKAAQS